MRTASSAIAGTAPGRGIHRPRRRERDVEERGVALLAQDLFLAGIDRHDAVAVALQVEADEVAGPQQIRGKAHDGDGPCGCTVSRESRRILIAGDFSYLILMPPPPDPALLPWMKAPQPMRSSRQRVAACRPRSRSQSRSSRVSSPTDRRIVPAVMPAASSSSSDNCRCVVLAG